jgi:hypothetical protein
MIGKTMTVAKVQHYVPQFLLRNFGSGKKDQVWVFDKMDGRTFSTNAKNIASESRFYDFELNGTAVSLEPMLSRLESSAKPIMKAILKDDSLEVIGAEEKSMLAAFFSVQFTRTKMFREQWKDFPRMLREHFEARGEQVASGTQAAELIRDLKENALKAETAQFMAKAPQRFAQHFATKLWLLIATTRKYPFVLSDNPLTLQNMTDMSPRGNLGLSVPGIEIYFPLSPVRALAMWCPSLGDVVRKGAQSLQRHTGERETDRANDRDMLLSIEDALRTGRPAMYKKENVENFNSLQIARSERYVFSSVNDFHLAEEMVRTHSNLRRGPRVQIA